MASMTSVATAFSATAAGEGRHFVQVSHSNYDTHNENFDFHLEQLAEFDLGFSNFVDIADRGMLDSTLIVVLSEFGRTPNINLYYGRDHWSKAWSVVMAGCRTRKGFAYGLPNADGIDVVDAGADHGNLFHLFRVGRRRFDRFSIDGRDLPIADPAVEAVKQLLV